MRKLLAIALATSVAACGISIVGAASTDATYPDDEAAADARPHEAAADVVDVGDAAVDVETPDASPDAAPPLVARLNIGGPAHVGVGFAGQWAASPVPGVCGPNWYSASSAIHGASDPPLFQDEAFGAPATCTVGTALAAGRYLVRLYFAEIYFGDGCPGGGGVGSRVFDILLEGDTVREDFDVLAESGGCLASITSAAGAPVVLTFEVVVSDGTLDIELAAKANNGKISALEVFGPL